jgi:4-methylaminobutanoate oxidase (formaldehyde-forming)
VIGTSVAYHLTKRGVTDVLLVEQGQLSCGTTWHAAGLVGQLRASESGTRLVQYSAALYDRLEAETGLGTGFRRCGGVTVARTKDRLTALRRTAATAEAFGCFGRRDAPVCPLPSRRRPPRPSPGSGVSCGRHA